MSLNSQIEWTDATWNPVRGCTKISPGCKHCYAETFAERFRGVRGHPYEQGFDLRLVPGKLTEPFSWRTPKLVFVNSMSDLFHDDVPEDYIEAVCRVMVKANWHTYQSAHETIRQAAAIADRPPTLRRRARTHLVGRKRGRPGVWAAANRRFAGNSGEGSLSLDRAVARGFRHV